MFGFFGGRSNAKRQAAATRYAAEQNAAATYANINFQRQQFEYAKEQAMVKPLDPENTYQVWDANSRNIRWQTLKGDDVAKFAINPDETFADRVAETKKSQDEFEALQGAVRRNLMRAPVGNAAVHLPKKGNAAAFQLAVLAPLIIGGIVVYYFAKGK